MFLLTLLATICFSNGAFSHSLFSTCKAGDDACAEKSANAAFPTIVAGIPELGVEPSDPIFLEKIEGNLSILKYIFYNTTITGYKGCHVENVKVDEKLTKVHYDLHCPPLTVKGQYEMDGRLIVLPVQGKGDFSIITGNYIVKVDCELKKSEGSDGKMHLAIKNFKLTCHALSANKFDFKNLFNGRKDLSDAVHNFAHQSWKEVAELVQEPTWYAGIKKVTANMNKYLKSVPIEELMPH